MSMRSILSTTALAAVLAGPAAAGDYELAPATLDLGGLQAGSTDYSASFSAAPGGEGASSNYRLRTGYAGQLFDPDVLPAVDFIPPGSLAADGSAKVFSASAAGVDGLLLTYEGRGFTNYNPSDSAPTAPGLYRVNASPRTQDHTGSAWFDFVISGPIAAPDTFTKPANNSLVSIRMNDLLANDTRILPDGTVTSEGLSIVGVKPGEGNEVSLGEGKDEGWVLFMSSSAATETFGYVVSDGTSTADGVVTLTPPGTAPAFTLQIAARGQPVFDGSRTTLEMDFIGVAGQDYQIEWSTDLTTWVSAGTSTPDPQGAFKVTFNVAGDHVDSWSQRLFFRAKR
jgi:hypothetical protein